MRLQVPCKCTRGDKTCRRRPAALLWALALFASGVVGCQGEPPGLDLTLTIARLSTCPLPDLAARLLVAEQGLLCPLAVSEAGFSGSCPGVALKKDVEITLEYFLPAAGDQELLLARASLTLDLSQAEEKTAVDFTADDLSYALDDDEDGLKNLDEACLGRDPRRPDAPRFTEVLHEEGSIGVAYGRFLVGERIRVLGSDLPEASLVRVTLGPHLGQPGSSLPVLPLAVTSQSVELQLPPGLDLADDVSLTLEALGQTQTFRLPVSRAWAAADPLLATVALLAHGDYASTPQSPPAPLACLELTGDTCRAICTPRLHDLSADGRLLIAGCTSGQGITRVIELPQRQIWSEPFTAEPQSSFKLLHQDRWLAVLQPTPASLAIYPLDAAQQLIGPRLAELSLPGASKLWAHPDGERLLVMAERATDQQSLLLIGLDEQGAPQLPSREIALPRCAEDCGATSLSPLDDNRVAVTRAGLNELTIVDLAAAAGQELQQIALDRAPLALAVSPRTRQKIYLAGAVLGAVKYYLSITELLVADLAKQPPPLVSQPLGLVSYFQVPQLTLLLTPEETTFFVTAQGSDTSRSDLYFADTAGNLLGDYKQGFSARSVLVQP